MARGKDFTRSASLERDRGAASVDSYVPTVRALELIERLTEDLERGSGGAYSIIGPYGSGKSSAALFIKSLFAAFLSGQKISPSPLYYSVTIHDMVVVPLFFGLGPIQASSEYASRPNKTTNVNQRNIT